MAQHAEVTVTRWTFQSYEKYREEMKRSTLDYYKKILPVTCGFTKDEANKYARLMVIENAEISPNGNDEDSLYAEFFLMVAVPVDREGRENFSEACKIRKTENMNFIKRYFDLNEGNETDNRVKYAELKKYTSFFCTNWGDGNNMDINWYKLVMEEQRSNQILDLACEGRLAEARALRDKPLAEDSSQAHHRSLVRTVMHDFLHEKCRETHLAHIVINGHGKKGTEATNPGGVLHVHEDGTVENQKIIDDITRCFKSIPDNTPPYNVIIVFAQCGALRSALKWKESDVEVVCLATSGKGRPTFSMKLPTTESKLHEHGQLMQYATEKQKEKETRPPSANI